VRVVPLLFVLAVEIHAAGGKAHRHLGEGNDRDPVPDRQRLADDGVDVRHAADA